MTRRKTALLLTALVLPGLGHLYLGRKVAGIAIIMLVNLLMLLALFVLLKGLAPVIAALVVSGGVNTADILPALQGVAGFGKALLAGFALVWFFSIIDCMKGRDDGEAAETTDRQ